MITDVAEVVVELLSVKCLLEKSNIRHKPYHLAQVVTTLRTGQFLYLPIAIKTEWTRRLLSVKVDFLASIS